MSVAMLPLRRVLLLLLLVSGCLVSADLSDRVNAVRKLGVGVVADRHVPSSESARLAALEFGVDVKSLVQNLLTELPDLQEILDRAEKDEAADDEKTTVSEISACANDTTQLLIGLATGESWSLTFLDSLPKPPSGLGYGNLFWFGNYDECLSGRGPNFSGTYCLVPVDTGVPQGAGGMATGNVTIAMGLCFPDSCSRWQVGNLTNAMLQTLSSSLGLKNSIKVSTPGLSCKVERWKLPWTTSAVCMMIFLCCLGLLIACATAYDVVTEMRSDKESGADDRQILVNNTEADSDVEGPKIPPYAVGYEVSANDANGETVRIDSAATSNADATKTNSVADSKKTPKNSTPIRLLLCFSAYANAKKLMDTKQPNGTLTCVHGIRFISMLWVILGHVYGTATYGGNLTQMYDKITNDWTFQAVLNATVSVDTFFVLSGLLMAYLFFRELDKLGGSLKKVNWVMFYVHRYWRLTPPYLLVMATYVTLGQYFYEGPLYPQEPGGFDQICPNNWWKNALYINNFFEQQCMAWSWYLANDMQFYVVSPLFLIPLALSPGIGLGLIAAVTLGSVTATGIHSTLNSLGAGFLLTTTDFNNIYVKPWFRIPPYLVGMATGYALYRIGRRRFRLHWAVNVAGWCVSIASALAIVYGLYNVEAGRQQVSQGVASLYNSTNRAVWGACVAWVTFVCVTGNAKWVNRFLSQPCFITLSRLTYCAYLVHPVIIYVYALTRRQSEIWDNLTAIYGFLGNAVLAYGVAFATSLAFESPLIGVERVLRGR